MIRGPARILRRRLQVINKVHAFRVVKVGILFVLLVLPLLGVFSYTRAGTPMRAYAATSSTLNFQARLSNSSGTLVPDGTYSIQFKLYDAAGGGTNEWTETQPIVTVRNGYLSVQLGSVTPFGASTDWSQEKWLTMNVNVDGEMTPRIKMTAVPYAFRSAQANSLTNGSGTLTADNLAQLAPSSVQAVNTAIAALRINQTGTGLLAQLQGNGTDVFTIAKTGGITSAGNGTLQGGTLQLGTATQSGGLVIHDGSGNTGTIQTAALGSNRTYLLPDADGTLCLTTTCGGGGGSSFVQDGNTFAGLATLGTNDNFDLHFETAGTTKLKILTNGNVGIGTSGTPSSLLSIGGTTGNLTVDSSGNLVTTGSLTSAGITSNGALTVTSGGANITGNIQASGQFLAANGSSATPSYSFTNNINSGIYSGGADNLRLVTGGADRVTVNNVGNVGIGTTDPSAALQVANGTTAMFGYIDSPFVSFGAYQNYLLQTEAFNTANWVKTGIGAVAANTATDPKLVATAENIPAGGSGTSNLSQIITNSTTGDWTFSVYLRSQAGTVTTDLRIDSNAPLTGTTKTVTLTTEWQRFAITQTISAAHTTKTVFIVSGTNAISAWGAQLEPTNFARPYSGARTTVALPAVTTTAQINTALTTTGALTIAGALTGATSGAFSSVVTATGSAIAATSTDRLVAANATLATAAIPVQMSPRLRLSGRVWNTTTVASNTTDWKIENLPLSGATPSGQLVFGHDLNGAGYTNAFVLNSNGNAAFAGSLSTGGTSRLTSTGVLQNITGLTVISGGASITGNITLGGSSSDRVTVNGQILGDSPLVFQGATDNGFATTFSITDSTANNTITVPNASGTLVLDSRSILTPAGSGLTGGGNLSVDRSLSLDINGLTTKTTVNPIDYLAIYDDTTSTVKKISRTDLLQGVIGALVYRGTWNASTNTPTLADNTATNGHTYAVSTGGTQNLGSGNITFGAGDFAIHNGTKWELAPSASPVISVFGRGGTVTAQGGDYTAAQITNTPAGNIAATTVQGALNELDNEKLGSLNGLTGNVQTFANDTNVTITSSGSTHTLGWTGQLSVSRGGTGAGSFTTNGIIYGNNTGALQVTAAGTAGQMLIADGSGVPVFRTISGDVTIDANGVAVVSGAAADSVALGTDTTGDYVMSLGTLTGLSTSGNSGEGSTPGLSVLYGATADTAVQGNTTLICPSGSGNLSGGGNTITLGTGGTCNNLNTNTAVTFTTSVTTPILTSSGGLAISSGGSGDINLNSGSNVLAIDGTDTTLRRVGSGSYTVELNDGGATTLVLNNAGVGAASLNLQDGGLQTNSITRLDNAGNLTNIGTIAASGNITTAGSLVEKSVTFTPTTPGWYRIASTNFNMGGVIRIHAPLYDNTLTDVELQYNISGFGAGGSIQQTRYSSYNTGVVSAARISTDGVASVYLDIFISTATAPQPVTVYGFGPSQPSFIASPVVGAIAGSTDENMLVLGHGFRSTQGAIFARSGGSVGIGTSGVPSELLSIGGTTGNLTVNAAGNIVTSGTYNTNTFTGSGLTFGAASTATVQSATDQSLNVQSQGSGVLTLTSGSGTIVLGSNNLQRSAASLTIDVNNAGLSTLNISNTNGSNLANLDVEGAIFAGSGNAFSVNSDGDITSAFTALNGTSTANGGSGLGTSTSLVLNSAANFEVGGYVQMNSANCGGTGINPCYAKITAKGGAGNNTLTIAPALRWTTGSTVNEYHIPELGGTNAVTEPLITRYGRGYFISGVATGNGTTFYNEDSIITSLADFDLLSGVSGTLSIGTGAGQVTIGSGAGTTTIAGTVNFSGNTTAPAAGTSGYLSRSGTTLTPSNAGDNFTTSGNITTSGSGIITAAAGLTVQGGGASITSGLTLLTGALNLTSGGITNAGSIAGATTISATGAITAATTGNTINGLIINSGTLSGVTGLTFTSGSLDLASGGITNAGSIAGITTLTGPGAVSLSSGGSGDLTLDSASNKIIIAATDTTLEHTAAGTYTIDLIDAAVTSLRLINSGAGTANLNLADGALSTVGVVRLTNAGALQNITSIGMSGALTLSASGTIVTNGLTGTTVAACTAGQYIGNGVRLEDGITVAGTCRNDATGISDQRVKNDVNTVGSVLDKLRGVNVVTFNFKVDEMPELNLDQGLQYGVIAQELEKIFPELVAQREDGYKEVNFQGLNFYNLKAVTELAAKVDALSPGFTPNEVKTGGEVRLTSAGELQNINGLKMVSGGASIMGGMDNNGGGITEAGAISGATKVQAQSMQLTANATDNLLELKKDSQGVFTVFNNGALELKADLANAFNVKKANGDDIFSVNTEGGLVRIGGSVDDDKAILLVLDSKNTAADPAGVNGAQYYNSALGKFRCYQDNRWQDCLPAANSEYVVMPGRASWQHGPSDEEFTGTPRVWVDLSGAHNYRTLIQLSAAGAAGAECYLQYALSDNGPWKNLSQPGGYMRINNAGSLKSEWAAITPDARKEVLVRVLCKGGDFTGSNAQTAAKPDFNSIRLQVR